MMSFRFPEKVLYFKVRVRVVRVEVRVRVSGNTFSVKRPIGQVYYELFQTLSFYKIAFYYCATLTLNIK